MIPDSENDTAFNANCTNGNGAHASYQTKGSNNSPLLGKHASAEAQTGDLKFHPLEVGEQGTSHEEKEDEIEIVHKLLGVEGSCFHISNLNALVILLLFTTFFAIAQTIAASIANSLSMYGDSASMFLDSLTYVVNIYAEYKKTKGSIQAMKLELIAATFSIIMLLIVTFILLWDAINRLLLSDSDQEVAADIMLEFSLANLAINIFTCGILLSRLAKERWGSIEENRQETTALNMASAFMHLLADTMRTITVLTSSIIVEEISEVNSYRADAISSIIVSTIIIFVCLVLMIETWGAYLVYRRIRLG